MRRPGIFSSSKLNLHNCIIYELEKCEESNKKEREQYWIKNIDCVNIYKLNFNQKEHDKIYYKNNKDKIKQYHNSIKQRTKYLDSLRYKYNCSWGGDKKHNNNLLCIDINLFAQ